MVTEYLLNIVFNIVTGLLEHLPEISWEVDTSAFAFVGNILSVVGYLLPMPTIIAIVAIICSLTAWKVLVSIITTLWDLLPIV